MNSGMLGTVMATVIKAEAVLNQCLVLDDGDDEEEFAGNAVVHLEHSLNNRKTVKKRKLNFYEVDSVDNAIEERESCEFSIPHHLLSDFRAHFNMKKTTFENLVNIIGARRDTDRKGRPSIPIVKQLLTVLWLLTHQEPFRIVSERFDIAKSTIECCFQRTICSIQEIYSQYIRWPSDSEAAEISKGFENISGVPNVIGAVDSIHIAIKTPRMLPQLYTNKHGFTSMVLQATCDHKMCFTSCEMKSPGSFSSEQVFNESDLLNCGQNNMLPNSYYLVGPSGYPLLPWLITPYNGSELSSEQECFNEAILNAHSRIRNALKMLIKRFQRLKALDMARVDLIPSCVTSACVIHNICILNDDLMDVSDINEEITNFANVPTTDKDGISKRDEIASQLLLTNNSNVFSNET